MKQQTSRSHAGPAAFATRPRRPGRRSERFSGNGPEERSLREQLERAARVQQSLLPDVSRPVGDLRLASLYYPCEALGGDFYDLIRRPDCVLLLLADVMGHGAEAALITMLVKAVFQETVETTEEPDEILAEMNMRLEKITPDGVFAAATVVKMRPGRAEVSLANSGLPYPFVLRCSRRRVEEVRLSGFPLGLFNGRASCSYRQRTVRLGPGDVLLLTSDGVGAVEGDDDQYFEDGRLRRALARLVGCEGRKVIDSLVAEALAFGNGRPLPDDINLVAISRDAETRRW